MAGSGSGLDDLVSAAMALRSEDTAGVRALHDRLTTSETIILAAREHLQSVIGVLSFKNHGLAAVHFLAAKAKTFTTEDDEREFLKTARQFLLEAQAQQVFVALKQFIEVVRAVTDISLKLGECLLSVRPLMAAAKTAQTAPTVLTAVHAQALKIILAAKAYRQGLALLQTPILSVGPMTTAQDTLLFFYYGGMVYTGVKMFDEAIEFYATCISVPAKALSAIVVEAAKKFILVSLIHTGADAKYPGSTSPAVANSLAHHVSPYRQLATFYKALNAAKTESAIAAGKRAFVKDNNFGLVKQVMTSLRRRKIQRLTDTYITLPLDSIASAAGLSSAAEAESHLLCMIEEGTISASIDKSNGMVSFKDTAETFDSPAAARRLQNEIARTMALAERVREVDLRISTSKAYVTKMVRMEHPDRSGAGAAISAAVHVGGTIPGFGVTSHPFAAAAGVAGGARGSADRAMDTDTPMNFDDVDLLGGLGGAQEG